VYFPVEVARKLAEKKIARIGDIFPFFRAENPAGVLFLFFVYVLTCARFLYPEIPSYFGGGRPQEVQLIVSQTEQQDLMAAGLHFPANSNQSAPIKLLLNTSAGYILLPMSKRTAIEVRRDLVRVVIYESNR
jgi:hypothetical protein